MHFHEDKKTKSISNVCLHLFYSWNGISDFRIYILYTEQIVLFADYSSLTCMDVFKSKMHLKFNIIKCWNKNQEKNGTDCIFLFLSLSFSSVCVENSVQYSFLKWIEFLFPLYCWWTFLLIQNALILSISFGVLIINSHLRTLKIKMNGISRIDWMLKIKQQKKDVKRMNKK